MKMKRIIAIAMLAWIPLFPGLVAADAIVEDTAEFLAERVRAAGTGEVVETKAPDDGRAVTTRNFAGSASAPSLDAVEAP